MGLFSRKSKPSTKFVESPDLGIATISEAVAAAKSGDIAQFEGIAARAASLDDIHAALTRMNDAADLDRIQAWYDTKPDDSFASTVYAQALVQAGWAIRGHGMAETVGASKFEGFFGYLEAAERVLQPALTSWERAPLAWCTATLLGRGLQYGPSEVRARFDRGVAAGGQSFLALHEQALQGICEKWSGSHEQMFAFAREHRDTAAPSPLNELIGIAHLEYWVSGKPPRGYISSAAVAQELADAAASSWLPGFPDDAAGIMARNTFAMTSYVSENKAEGARQIAVIGDRIPDWPWYYLRTAGKAIAELRTLAPE